MEQPIITSYESDKIEDETIFIVPKDRKSNNKILHYKSEHDNVLTLCPPPESINIDTLKESISNYMGPRIEYYKDKKRAPFIEDELSEYFVAKASDGKEIGGGHCAMDVRTKENEGIDVTCIVMNKSTSNEKSLIQNFKEAGLDLDTLFKEKQDDEAVKLFMENYLEKLENVKKDKNLNKLYILAYISTKTDVYIACFKINIEKLLYVKSGGFVDAFKKDNYVNINIDNFIDPNIGNVRIYKSKKRMELRFKKEILNEEHVFKIYSMP